MTRWAWTKTVTAALACAGFAAGQVPSSRVSVAPAASSAPSESRDGPREGAVIVLRTAGQPERKVKVLRVTKTDSGESLADLQDQATGARYTVPARMLTARPVTTAPPARVMVTPNSTKWNASTPPTSIPKPLYSAPPPSAPTPQYSAVSTSPAKPQYTAAPKPVTVSPPVAKKEEPPAPRIQPAPPVQAKPAVVMPSVVALKALEQKSPQPPRVAPTVAHPPTETVPVTHVAGLERPRYAVAAPPPLTPMPVERPAPPPVVPIALTSRPVAAVPTTTVVQKPAPEIRPAGLLDPLPMHLAPSLPPVVVDPMAEETGPYVRDLFGALRPSVRERAATALAECRYASRPEVKTQLAKAAADDPSPDVRAHCVRILSKLGYHESRYLDELAGWAESAPAPLKQAATDALARMTLKN